MTPVCSILLTVDSPIPESDEPLTELRPDRLHQADQGWSINLPALELMPEMESAVTGQLQHRPLGAGPPVLAAQARASRIASALQHALEVAPDVAVA
jgi:hypothetical protein